MLSKKKKYLQIALNSTIEDACDIISRLPPDQRIILEAGTPLIKNYGAFAIRKIKQLWEQRLENEFNPIKSKKNTILDILIETNFKKNLFGMFSSSESSEALSPLKAYVVADLKCMDRGFREVIIAKESGASAATALGNAPVETLNSFIGACKENDLDSMIDMMNVEHPTAVLSKLKEPPNIVILHRGVDEEDFNPEKEIPYYEIQNIKSAYDIMIAVAGGDEIQEAQRAIFNDADIVVVWRAFYKSSDDTIKLAKDFLKEIR